MQAELSGEGWRWLPVGQAAAALGISERTLRRHTAAGEYQTRHVLGRLEVLVRPPANGLPVFAVLTGAPDEADDTPPDMPDGATGAPDEGASLSGAPASPAPAVAAQALATLERVLAEERARAERERERASQAEQAAAMWQERARNLETQVEQLLALPAHEEEPPRRGWWPFRRRG